MVESKARLVTGPTYGGATQPRYFEALPPSANPPLLAVCKEIARFFRRRVFLSLFFSLSPSRVIRVKCAIRSAPLRVCPYFSLRGEVPFCSFLLSLLPPGDRSPELSVLQVAPCGSTTPTSAFLCFLIFSPHFSAIFHVNFARLKGNGLSILVLLHATHRT